MSLSLPQEAIPERKVPVILRHAFTVFLERTSGLTFVHCDLHVPYTKTVRAQIKADWYTLLTLHPEPIYALHLPGDRKHETWLRLFDFSYVTTFTAPDGTIHDLYRN